MNCSAKMPLLLKLPNCQRTIRQTVVCRGPARPPKREQPRPYPVTFYRGCRITMPRGRLKSRMSDHRNGQRPTRQEFIPPGIVLPYQPLATCGWLTTDERRSRLAPSVETRNIPAPPSGVKRCLVKILRPPRARTRPTNGRFRKLPLNGLESA